MIMKRELDQFDDHGHNSHIALANCLMLLSQSQSQQGYNNNNSSKMTMTMSSARVFECKTCNKKFTSFQALGGHRASHKKPKLSSSDDQRMKAENKTMTHECSICGVEFALGQALGGHMRKHRGGGFNDVNQSFVPIVKKPNGKRVLWMDLNLTPSENVHLHLRKPSPNLTVNFI